MGAGYFSRFQCEAWTRIPEVEMVAVLNRTEHKARALMAEFGMPLYYGDWKEMIEAERPDFVDIITSPDTPESMCSFAAHHGVNIICQKPLAPTFEESCRIVETAKSAGVRLMVHENWRWQPWYRKIKEIQRLGTIGDFTHTHFFTRLGDGWGENACLDRQPFFRDCPKLLIYETGVHFIDTSRYLLGEVSEVYAHLRRLNPAIQGEDTGQLFLKFENGATATWDANRYNEVESPSPRYTFGQLGIDATRGHLTMSTESTIRIKALGQPAYDLDYSRRADSFGGDCVYHVQRHFVDCILSGREFESSGEDYLKTLRIVDAAYDSASNTRIVTCRRDAVRATPAGRSAIEDPGYDVERPSTPFSGGGGHPLVPCSVTNHPA